MLVLKRKEGQWVEITHTQSGDTLRIRVYDICGDFPGRANLAFDDPNRFFEIQRPERIHRLTAESASTIPPQSTPEPEPSTITEA